MSTPQTPIADKVAQMVAGRPPSTFTAEQARLRTQPPPEVAKIGSLFPDGALLDTGGGHTSFADTVAGAPAVVIFYRGAWCPYCNLALATYREQLLPILSERGIVLVAISPQKADGSLTMKEKHDLDFAVLSDPGNQIAGALGILTAPSDEARAAQLDRGLDLTQLNADGTTTLAMPTIAIVDGSGTLVWIDVHPDYSTRTEPEQVLAALDDLGL